MRILRSSCIPVLLLTLPLVLSFEARLEGYLNTGEVYSDVLPPNTSKDYLVKPGCRGQILLLHYVASREGTVKPKVVGPVNETVLSIAYYRAPSIYYISGGNDVKLIFENLSLNSTVSYRFYVDLSTNIEKPGIYSKTIPLDGGFASFKLDLRRGDKVEFKVNPLTFFRFRIEAYVLCYEVAHGSVRYMLTLYRRSEGSLLTFEADLEGAYYIMVESTGGPGEFKVECKVIQAPWSQTWFWMLLLGLISSLTLLLTLFWMKTYRAAGFKRWFLLSDVSAFAVLAGLACTVAAYEYRASSLPLCYSTILYGLSAASRFYGILTERRSGRAVCRYCGRTIDLRRVNICCGRRVKEVSPFWYATAPLLAFLAFLSGLTLKLILDVDVNIFTLGVVGGLIGSFTSWHLNRRLDEGEALKLLASGLTFTILFPVISLVLAGLLGPTLRPIELGGGGYARIRVSPATLPLTFHVVFTGLALTVGAVLASDIRKLLLGVEGQPTR